MQANAAPVFCRKPDPGNTFPSGAAERPGVVDIADNDALFDGGRHDHFIRRDGQTFAGTHLLVDLWGGARLDDLPLMESALRDAVAAAGATLLHIHLHHFTPNGGISGVAVLAESHISVHSWPEADFAAFDVFMCGDAEPHKAIDVLRRAFDPQRVEISEQRRGIVVPGTIADPE